MGKYKDSMGIRRCSMFNLPRGLMFMMMLKYEGLSLLRRCMPKVSSLKSRDVCSIFLNKYVKN